MSVTINDPEPIINVTIAQRPEFSVEVKYTHEPKIVQVAPGVLRGPKGDSPDRSVYSKKEIEASGPDLEIDAATGTTFFIKLKSSIANLHVTNWPNDGKTQRIAIYFEQDSIGSKNVLGWPPNTRWSYGQYPVLTPKPGAIDCIVLDTFDGGATIFGGIVGIDYA